jgi:hypothetical protein
VPGDCVCRRSEEDRAATLVEEQELRKTLRASISKLKAARPLTVIDGAATLSCAAERAATLACYREHPSPTLVDVTKADLDKPLMTDEIFGPLLPIYTVRSMDEASACKITLPGTWPWYGCVALKKMWNYRAPQAHLHKNIHEPGWVH